MGSSSLGPTASATATTAPTLAAAPVAIEQPAADEKTQEISALLQQANAMLNKLTRLQAIQVATDSSVEELIVQMQGLGFSDEERMALLDSGASTLTAAGPRRMTTRMLALNYLYGLNWLEGKRSP